MIKRSFDDKNRGPVCEEMKECFVWLRNWAKQNDSKRIYFIPTFLRSSIKRKGKWQGFAEWSMGWGVNLSIEWRRIQGQRAYRVTLQDAALKENDSTYKFQMVFSNLDHAMEFTVAFNQIIPSLVKSFML